jgi:hypothetical protein
LGWGLVPNFARDSHSSAASVAAGLVSDVNPVIAGLRTP